MDPFSQEEYAASLEWGPRGVRMATARGDIVVLVDVLRFCSTVAAAVEAGVVLIPAAMEEAADVARHQGAVVGNPSLEARAAGRFTLSPDSFAGADSGTRVVISSANGAACARFSPEGADVFASGLVNARAVGRWVNLFSQATGRDVTVVACGERWLETSDEGDLRFAVEDYLGAGAILSHLELRLSPEAEVCRAAFEASRKNLRGVLWECASGRELRERGLGADVDYCSALNMVECVPVLREGAFVDARSLT